MGLFARFKSHRITNENWEFYESFEEDENVVFTSIDLTYLESSERKGFKGEVFVRIRIPKSKLNGGIPIPAEHEWQNMREEALCERLLKNKVKCKQVARITFGGQKQYVFEYNDLGAFIEIFQIWQADFSSEYKVELHQLEAFEYYTDLLPDKFGWQQIENRKVIEKLLSAGSDRSKQHFIEHGIFGTKERLTKLLNEIKKHEMSLIKINDDFMEVGVKSSIELDDITNQTDYLIDVSEKHQCKYDGWSATIVK